MNRRTFIATVGAAGATGLAGCLGGSDDTSDDQQYTTTERDAVFDEVAEADDGGTIERFIDEDAGVVCYRLRREGAVGSGAGWESGLSCVPLNETDLDTGDF